MVHRVTYKIGNEELVLETGRIAKQANGAVYARFGGSAVIVTKNTTLPEKSPAVLLNAKGVPKIKKFLFLVLSTALCVRCSIFLSDVKYK